MAKGKHAAALFEVINSDKKYDRAKTGAMLKTPKWWTSSTASAPAAPTKTVRVAVEKPDPAPVAHGPTVAIDVTPADSMKPTGDSMKPTGDSMKPTADRMRTAMNLDADQQQIAFKLSYTTALVAGFALLVVIVMAYVIGKKIHGGPSQAIASAPTSVIKSGALLDGVLDVGPTDRKPVSGVIPVTPTSDKPNKIAPAPSTPAPHTTPETAPPARVIDDARRIVGLNYLIVQSYPESAQATEARDALQKAGIDATVEKTPPSFGRKDWFSVIGTKGFDRIKSREFENYVAQVEAVGAKFASDRSFKAFKPQAFKWK